MSDELKNKVVLSKNGTLRTMNKDLYEKNKDLVKADGYKFIPKSDLIIGDEKSSSVADSIRLKDEKTIIDQLKSELEILETQQAHGREGTKAFDERKVKIETIKLKIKDVTPAK